MGKTILSKFKLYVAGREIQIGAAILLLLALADWPYGYYQFLRLAICTSASISAWQQWRLGNRLWATGFGCLAMMFNPFQPVHFHRQAWAWIDSIAALIFATCPSETPKRLDDADQT